MSISRNSVHRVALTATAVAITPYVTLKALWLAGSTIGVTSSAGLAEMHEPRFVVGNVITVALMLLALAFLVALTGPWAARVPAQVVLVLGVGATGLLAPILLGLPLGLVVQAVLRGEVRPAEDGLAMWVFGVVYAGFGVLALAILAIVTQHVVDRWGPLLSTPPRPPAWGARVAGALGLLPFAAAMGYWGVVGPGETGPPGMDLPAQRTVLLVTAALAATAYLAPWWRGLGRARPRLAWLVTWTGCCVAALQGPTQILLAQGGKVTPLIALIAALATPGSVVYGLAVLKNHLDARRVRVGAGPGVDACVDTPALHVSSAGQQPGG